MAALAAVLIAACALPPRTSALVEGSFGAGVRVPARQDDETPLVAASGALGGVWWATRGEGPLAQTLGLGGLLSATWFDLERADLGIDLVVVPPRLDRRIGFQLRLGGRVATGGEHAGGSFAAEWYDAALGGLFAEAQYDVLGEEASFLVGARVNLLFPVTYVRLIATPLD